MKKKVQLLISSLKTPISYYIWGGLSLLYGSMIALFSHLSRKSIFFILSGVVVIVTAVFIDLGKYRVKGIKDTELDKRIGNLKSKYWQNVIRNITTFCTKYRSRDMYLCRFYRKTGTTLVVFVDSLEKAKEYMNWYLGKDIMTYKNINITSNKATKIKPDDIEEFEYQRVSWVQQEITYPLLAFLKQPSRFFISFNQIFIVTILLIFVGVGYGYISSEYTFNRYTFTGENSIDTLAFIYRFIKSALMVLLPIWFVLTLGVGISSMDKAIKNFYIKKFESKKTIFRQLLIFTSIPLCYVFILNPIMCEIIEFARAYGYFLP